MADKTKEILHLSYVNSELNKQIKRLKGFIDNLKNQIIDEQETFKELRSSTKYKDIKVNIKSLNVQITNYDDSRLKNQILSESIRSAFFGSIIFDNDKFYIGKFSVQNFEGTEVLVNDWRAPISSVFYDFELGQAHYLCPAGLITGELSEKMQYKIVNSELLYMFDTSITINDEILQQALAENTSSKMKTIVSTIQKKQNEIIRKPLNQSVVVQGVAGSGKTSIALHRIAYLLYNNRKNLTSKNILVFSPNNVFSSYISTVLPELGEENCKELTFDEIFKREFDGVSCFEKRHIAIEKILEGQVGDDVAWKNSEYCLTKLNEFLTKTFNENFVSKSMTYKNFEFTIDKINEYVNEKPHDSVFKRLLYAASALESRVEVAESLSNSASEKLIERFFSSLLKMLKQKNVFKIYAEFLSENGFKFKRGEVLTFEDAMNILYIKNSIFGTKVDYSIKQVVIDEMQDYSPVALNIIKTMFDCEFTCLGDIYQTIDSAFNINKLDYITKVFGKENNGVVLELKQNYRSTYEIASFANSILGLKFDESPVRNGEPIHFVDGTGNGQEIALNEAVRLNKKFKTVGLLCKTMNQATQLFLKAKQLKIDCNLVRPENEGYTTGISISAAHVVKGLEFDCVVIANASSENFKNAIDKQSLYVAATRTLHELSVCYDGELTSFVDKK